MEETYYNHSIECDKMLVSTHEGLGCFFIQLKEINGI